MPRMDGNTVSITGNSSDRFYIDWQLAGQDITNNYSAINWQAKFYYSGSDAQLDNGSASLSGTRWSNGGRVRNFAADFSARDVTLASGSFTIGHNADGTQGISVSGGVDVYQTGRSSGSQSFSLPTIPRNSQVTSTSSTALGNPVQINTNRKSSSFTHTITIRMHNSGGTVLQTINSVGDSTIWTPSPAQITQMQNAIPNSNSLTLWIWSHNNQVGQGSETTTRLDITDANPIYSDFTYKDSNASVATITGNDQVLVKGKSTLEVTVPSGDKMVAQKGANPDYYAIAYDGVSNNLSYSTSNVTSDFTNIDTVGSRAILVTAYDSRTNNTRVAKNVQVYDYTPPNIEFEVTRENNFGEDVTIETGGTFDLLPINGVNKNSLTASSLKYRYKEKGAATWGTWANIPFTVTDDGFAGTNQFISLDNTKEFEFEFQVADKFGTVNQATELGAGTPIMFAGRYSNGDSAVGINKVPENGVLDVDGDIYSNGEKVVTGDLSAINLANPYKFSVYRAAALNSTSVDTVIAFDTKTFDTGTNVDVVTNKGRFTAPVAGFYFFTACAGNTAATTTIMRTGLFVNGVLKKLGNQSVPDTANNLFTVSGLLQLAASDYVEASFVGGSGSVMQVGASQCYFDGFLVSTT